MATEQHTTGPWTVKKAFGSITVETPSGRSICDIVGDMPIDEANARLIAAAPELLEALESITELLQNAIAADDGHSADELGQCENLASQLIKKAKG